ncbi:DUF3450 family protein [Luteolibacter pohnpeiensis]|uniref:DUF3450 family protein n=1 Tax=Luteolibacter pohnpeiensis TaxID=454153 RepID=A0A934S9C0_9BACT|nr:DUF3450 family protein [Luteolibacter pohnpeiensis]MBK1884203.1 DUF3450 family protein [Luteolibacter pohnpeiensis]
MRFHVPLFSLFFVASCVAQEVKVTPTEELRTTVHEWVETMQKIQTEENDWGRDQEVLQNYREGLEKEITDLKEQIAAAKTRKDGADQESLDKSKERDRYAKAKDDLATIVRGLEEKLAPKLRTFPKPLLEEPKVAQGIEDFQRDYALPADKRGENVSKRLLNVINLLTEAEKFQQAVHLRAELHQDTQGREFNMQVIYFGLAQAYAVNDDGSFALVGRPTSDGWKFEEHKELAADIQQLVASTTGDQDAAFVNLPFSKP